MTYTFRYQTRAFDLWKLSMYGIYSSLPGLVNAIFTAAMIALTVRFWSEVGILYRLFILFGLSIFTIIQPMVVYAKATRQVSNIPDEVEMHVTKLGMDIETGNKMSHLTWKQIKGIVKKPGMLVIIAEGGHGFILTDATLGDEKDAFYKDVMSYIKG